MSPKTIKFGDKELNKKEFYSSKQAVNICFKQMKN